jgi:hypothetical protein
MPSSRRRKLLYIIGGMLFAVVGALAVIWWRGVPFPQTTGPFKVGRASFHLVDSSRKEIFSENPDDVRELMVTVHYPAEVSDGVHFSAYADPRLAAALAEAYGVPRFLSGLMHCHAVDGAPAAKKEGGFPVVIFSPGGDSHPLFYSAMLEELASQGFIVASVCHTYTTGVTVFPDGRAVRANDAGCRFERLERRHEGSAQTIAKARDAIGAVWLATSDFRNPNHDRAADRVMALTSDPRRPESAFRSARFTAQARGTMRFLEPRTRSDLLGRPNQSSERPDAKHAARIRVDFDRRELIRPPWPC